ncbi:MAG TPA: GAF domain-containing sensor histidine kinase [Chitinophaga sp.]
MKNGSAPIPANEMERLISLAEFDIDYDSLNEQFKSLTRLAAKIAGTEISLINLIDAYTLWTISDFGISMKQMPREETVCQYTIANNNAPLEIPDLATDARFKDKPYVTGGEQLRYYWGTPLRTFEGHNLGALCVIDRKQKALSPEKKEMLVLIAEEIVSRLATISVINKLKNKVFESEEAQKKLTHDIRGPVSGIITMAQLISEQGQTNNIEDILSFISMIQKSGHSLLELADEILSVEQQKNGAASLSAMNLSIFRERLMKLYLVQASAKGVTLSVRTNTATETIPVNCNKLLQITGNLVSNAIKFTPPKGRVSVELDLKKEDNKRYLEVKVSDTGVGISAEAIYAITQGNAGTTQGTGGEKGFGFGLSLVKHLVEKLKGSLSIQSSPGEGSSFVIRLPQ